MRPAWASWIPATAPWLWTNRAIRASGSACASLQIPMSPGVIRPSRVTAVASTTTSDTPPTARLPRWTRCQSSAMPSVAQYWHIGDITTRFRKLDPADLERAEQVDLRDLAVVHGVRRAAMGVPRGPLRSSVWLGS